MLNPKWTATFGTRICAICKTDFIARQHNAKYCSMACYCKRTRKEYATEKTTKHKSPYEDGLHDGQQIATYQFIRMLRYRQKNTAPNSGAGREIKDIIRELMK